MQLLEDGNRQVKARRVVAEAEENRRTGEVIAGQLACLQHQRSGMWEAEGCALGSYLWKFAPAFVLFLSLKCSSGRRVLSADTG